uniref:Uncharacterized protein n=1 Tax=Panagrolaimus sp. ES5 TaxID=591445 RepID=A0AC34G109_9BILA
MQEERCLQLFEAFEALTNVSNKENPKSPQTKKRKLSANFSSLKKRIIKAPYFKLIFFKYRGAKRRRLIVFSDDQQKLCHIYLWKKDEDAYYCRNCKLQRKRVMAKICQNSMGEDYVKLDSNLHICELQEFNPEEYLSHTVQSTDFRVFNYTHRGITKSTLVIFDPSNKNLCYEFFWDNRRKLYECSGCHMSKGISAVIRQDEKGEDYVEMDKIDHIYIKKKYCYKFAYFNKYNFFGCVKCQQVGHALFAHLLTDKNGNQYISMKNKPHLCKPIEYVQSQFIDKKKVLLPNYQIITRKANGKFVKHLAIFDSNDKSLCYEYTWAEERRSYTCYRCQKLNRYVHARILKNKDGIETKMG